ncbi:MAG: hypothetical protein HKN90_01460 [Flavobacteriaceae bacterium]|nr:hypothetical protein [Flavobacteriaceae bacterium]
MQFNSLTNNRFNFIIALLTIIILISCERDDICIDETTPDLIFKFLDVTDGTLTKGVSGLKIKFLETEIDTIILSGDSIFIPLRIDRDTTKYSMTNQISTDDVRTDTIVISYERQEVFVGRSCGYKMNFNALKIESSTTNWIQNITTVNSPLNIENETAAHINITH